MQLMRRICVAVKSNLEQFAVRTMSSEASAKEPKDPVEDVVFSRVDTKRVIVLNRPAGLNALNLSMIRKIYPKMQEWETPANMDKSVDLVIIKGQGHKAFCAGGDVRSIADTIAARKAGKTESTLTMDFFKEEYRLNYLIGTYGIPYVALIDGITMGGGVGLSVHGRFRVATDRTVFAMPETAIGFFPDVGGSYFLPRLPGHLGMFLGLTGHRLTGRDVFAAGVATHYVESNMIDELEKQLIAMDPSKVNFDSVALVLAEFQHKSGADHQFSLQPHLSQIDSLFNGSTVEQICENLERDGSEWAIAQLEAMKTMSPTSLKVTHRELREGEDLPMKECFKMEYRLSQRFCEDHDFYEGVRATLIDKDKAPKWHPKKLNDMTSDKLDWYFSKLPEERELLISR